MIVEEAKHNPIPTIVFTIFSIIMITFSIYTMIDLIRAAAGDYIYDPDINQKIKDSLSVIKDYISLQAVVLIILGIVGLIILVFLVSMIVTWLMSRIAAEVSIVICFTLPVLIFIFAAIVFGVVTRFATDQYLIIGYGTVALIALIGAVITLIVIWKSRAIIRAGKFIEFAAELIIDNKSLYIFPILMAIGAGITTIMGSISGIWVTINGDAIIYGILENIQNQTIAQYNETIARIGMVLALFIVEFFYLLLYFIIYYILSGMIMSYAARYYVGEDPGPKTAIRDIREVLPIIIKFATFTTSIHMLLKQIDRLREKTRFPFNIIFGLFHWIIKSFYAFFTYFALPAIVIKKKGLLGSTVESGKLVWKHGIDVLVSETGFNLVMLFFSMVNRMIWAIIGFSVGSGLSELAGGRLIPNIIIGIVIAVVFFYFLSPISLALITMPMKSAFTCFLYCHAIGIEEGVKSDRMPRELETDLKAISKEAIDTNKRKMKNPEAV
ncbi:MAG: hypothetical protein ACXAEU_18905 [Candidatus Hodarchaeales archaeon]|jgi:hypothetical protein